MTRLPKNLISMRTALAGIALALLPIPAVHLVETALAPADTLPLVPTRPLQFTTDEGTWLSLDVSPDGKTIIFELLGDLYTLPIEGGKATRITSGQGFDTSPRYSPDGTKIVFVSDRTGSDNLWIAKADGTEPKQLTKTDWLGYVSPEWTPDGNYIVVARNNPAGRSHAYYGPFNLWLYHITNGFTQDLTGGSGVEGGRGSSSYSPAFGKDPRYIYFARGGTSTGGMQVVMMDRATGQVHQRTNERRSAMRPAISPDGRYLVFAAGRDSVTGLKIRSLETGDERWLAPIAQHDQVENFASERDFVPAGSFTPDSKSFIVAYNGKIHRLDVATGADNVIPFSADVDQMLGPPVKFEYGYNDSLLTVRQIRWPRLSPDGSKVVFSALDKVWVVDVASCVVAPGATTPSPSCQPKRLTDMDGSEGYATWSPDGQWIAFARWSERDGGGIFRVRSQGGDRPARLTRDSAYYYKITYSPSGTRIFASREPKLSRLEESGRDGDFIWIPSEGGAPTVISPSIGGDRDPYGIPHFGPDTSRIVLKTWEGLVTQRLDGYDRQNLLKATVSGAAPNTSEPATDMVLSPTGDLAVAIGKGNVYLITLPPYPRNVSVGLAGGPLLRKVTRIGGDFLAWQNDGKQFSYSFGNSLFIYNLADAATAIADSAAQTDSTKRRGYEPRRALVAITVPKDRPQGAVLLRGARIITMKGNEIIENGDILVRNNRIAAIGPTGTLPADPNVTTIDVTGKTIIPGYVDVHAHMWQSNGLHSTEAWEYLVNLAFGVTTTRDPQTSSSDVFDYADRVEAGDVIGPRIFATGSGIFGDDNVRSLDDMRDLLRRYSEYFHSETLKQYLIGNRLQRQWAAIAAREQGITPTTESGLQEKMTLTFMLDGYMGLEHSLTVYPVFKDVIELHKASGATYTPTLVVAYGGPASHNYWIQHYDMHDDAKLQRFWPHSYRDRQSLTWTGYREGQYVWVRAAAQAAKFNAAGGKVGMGSHGNIQGIGAHFELWSLAMGGIPNHDILKIATINGADAIGHAKDLGSLEVGKLADLQVLDANPIENIRNSTKIRYVMLNGRLYDGSTLDEVWPRKRPLPPMYLTGEER